MRAPKQCVILIGGLGTRLGALTADIPKPMVDVGGRPFLEYLLVEAARFGFSEVLLLAGYRAESVARYIEESGIDRALDLSIEVLIEDSPAGTGGALWRAQERLRERFFLINGDSWFDFNWLSLVLVEGAGSSLATLALRYLKDADRYGVVETHGHVVREFLERPRTSGPGNVNSGVYLVSRDIVRHLSPTCSIERDIFPVLAANGDLCATVATGHFIDIGIPADLSLAQSEIPAWQRRPAVFLDRDGTLNEDEAGYTHSIDDFRWLPGAIEAVRRLNDARFYVFVVTNQAGVARGIYSEEKVVALHAWIQDELRAQGAHIDDFRYCPFHPEGLIEAYRQSHPWRKPGAGMLLDLMKHWQVDITRSAIIGDKDSDVEAGRAASVLGLKVKPGDLLAKVTALIERGFGELPC
jgi:D-glycero-D-manno-heptose 1,7-bisphosphate phosphatase